ncbi:MoeA N-terminal region-domain-containing protein [Tribonema minus]|uniref:MoeA N-terminal region-domain-containing protein n=1 Tax=Tribonema minus TaxID=303371 RepID=A0A835YS15_9STRA|nr:MoeA N-terminal region-domain-containing protein [Tribonema minus]
MQDAKQQQRSRGRGRESSFPMISVDEAIAMVLEEAEALPPVTMPLADVPMGSTLSADAVAPDPLPPFPASIMDGYAVVAADTAEASANGGCVLEVVARITAGVDAAAITVGPGQCAYITTGAKLPKGADAVVKVEDTQAMAGDASLMDADEKTVRILKGVAAGTSIRPIGSDIAQGEVVLTAGTRVTPAEVGLLATCGIATVTITPLPVVGIMSTGDELVEPGESISGGMIRDSNRATLLAFVKAQGATAVDLGIVRDVAGGLEEALKDALQRCDVVVTSGGVSMGEADLIKPLLEQMGTLHFGRICMKPGKPTTFATVPGEKKLVLAMPGNPVSCLVTSHLFCAPAMRRLSGQARHLCMHSQVQVVLAETLKLDPERPEYHRAVVTWDSSQNALLANSTGPQASCRLLSMRGSNALLCLPAASGVAAAGSLVTALLIGDIPPPSAPARCFHARAAGASAAEAQHGSHDHAHGASGVRTVMTVALLTVSDRASQGVYEDLSGPAMAKCLTAEDIQACIMEWCDVAKVDLILTSGGTGFGRRDLTPEAIAPLLQRHAPGIVHAIYQAGLKHTPLAVLSRPVAGTRGNTLVVTLPGSVKAVNENMTALVPLLPRIVNLLQGNEC